MCQAAVAFVDTDGDRVEYRMNSTSGKLDVFVNGQLKCKGLTKLTRDGATLTWPPRTTAPDEDTAQRVIALFNIAEVPRENFRVVRQLGGTVQDCILLPDPSISAHRKKGCMSHLFLQIFRNYAVVRLPSSLMNSIVGALAICKFPYLAHFEALC